MFGRVDDSIILLNVDDDPLVLLTHATISVKGGFKEHLIGLGEVNKTNKIKKWTLIIFILLTSHFKWTIFYVP